MALSSESVFINVPFDSRYTRLFHALVFVVADCGFRPRCALEGDDGTEVRIDKLCKIIESSALGVHDLSRTSLDGANRLPRFNMPLELGLFLGAKRFGNGRHKKKSALILERDQFRYQKYCSDIAGQDIRAHNNRIDDAVSVTRNWLQANRDKSAMPPAKRLVARYLQFRADLPSMCKSAGGTVAALTFIDYRTMVDAWRGVNPLAV